MLRKFKFLVLGLSVTSAVLYFTHSTAFGQVRYEELENANESAEDVGQYVVKERSAPRPANQVVETKPVAIVQTQRIISDRDAPQPVAVQANTAQANALAQPGATETPAQNSPVATERVVRPSGPDAYPEQEMGTMRKAEMMRRQRMREELKNEDLLTQKLEEMRLKEELKRTDEILGRNKGSNDASVSAVDKAAPVGAAAASTAIVQSQAVGTLAPQPIEPAVAPAASSAANKNKASSLEADADAEQKPITQLKKFSIAPQVGFSKIINSYYKVEPQVSGGVSLGFAMMDYLGLTVGYNYTRYTIQAGNAITYPSNYFIPNFSKLYMNDHHIDLGLRAFLFGQDSVVRPFVGGKVGYRFGSINYGDQTKQYIRQYYPSGSDKDVSIKGFTGGVEAGSEFSISEMFGITASFEYAGILSSSQNQNVSPAAFVYPNYSGYIPELSNKDEAGKSLSKSSYYRFLVGAQLRF